MAELCCLYWKHLYSWLGGDKQLIVMIHSWLGLNQLTRVINSWLGFSQLIGIINSWLEWSTADLDNQQFIGIINCSLGWSTAAWGHQRLTEGINNWSILSTADWGHLQLSTSKTLWYDRQVILANSNLINQTSQATGRTRQSKWDMSSWISQVKPDN